MTLSVPQNWVSQISKTPRSQLFCDGQPSRILSVLSRLVKAKRMRSECNLHNDFSMIMPNIELYIIPRCAYYLPYLDQVRHLAEYYLGMCRLVPITVLALN